MNLKRFLLSLVLCVVLNNPASAEPSTAPAFKLPSLAGKEVSLSDFKGKVVYLDFWASWCPPCLIALPWLNEMSEQYESKDFKIIAINLDQKRKDADRVLAKVNPKFEVLFDPEGKVASAYQLPSMPTSFLIGRNGELLHVHKGFRSSDKDRLEAEIRKHLVVKE